MFSSELDTTDNPRESPALSFPMFSISYFKVLTEPHARSEPESLFLADRGTILGQDHPISGGTRFTFYSSQAQTLKMGLREKYSTLNPYQKLGVWGAIASILALVIAVFTVVPRVGIQTDDILTQKGLMTQVKGTGTYEVFYPQPYQTTPELTWPKQPLAFQVLEQRPDGFIVRITSWADGDPHPEWQAEGMARRNDE